jgi:gamma-glutamyl-gamma-aminobutyrate hydrolase PuuD
VLTAFVINLMTEAASISETSVSFYEATQRNIPDDGHLNTRSRENLKSHLINILYESKLSTELKNQKQQSQSTENLSIKLGERLKAMRQ